MTLLHFHSHHPLSCKEGIIYSQALRYNMIISEDHILQAELNNLTRILLARSYPLHLIIKNIKKALIHSCNYLLSQQTPHTKTNILPIQPTPNPTLFTLHKHRVAHGKTPRTTTHTHPHTPIRTYPHITTVVTPVFSSIPDTPNSSWCHGQWMERQDILWRSWYHTTLMLLIWEVQLRIVNFNIFGSNNITLHNL